MKITFFSNFMNHHQLPFSQEMFERLGDNYRFVATSPVDVSRLSMGYEDMNKKYSYIITTYDSEENKRYAKHLAMDSDVIITGSAPDYYMADRLKVGKLTFKYSERFFKRGLSLRQMPRAFASAKWHLSRFQKYPLYFLCASAYTASDVNRFSNYKNRTFKWGYFPEIKSYDIDSLLLRKNPTSILWVGRLLELKHPDDAIRIAKRLRSAGQVFDLNIIGSGDMESTLNQMIVDNNLCDCVHLLGAMSPQNVREYMENAAIFLFTSDFNEGWGAVLNEAMNSGCAVVASHAIGSVPFLLKNETNGFVYKNGDNTDLYKKVMQLLNDINLQKKYGRQAYLTMANQWNAKRAVERFLLLTRSILENNEPFEFVEGVCSKAEIIDNNWFGGSI